MRRRTTQSLDLGTGSSSCVPTNPDEGSYFFWLPAYLREKCNIRSRSICYSSRGRERLRGCHKHQFRASAAIYIRKQSGIGSIKSNHRRAAGQFGYTGRAAAAGCEAIPPTSPVRIFLFTESYLSSAPASGTGTGIVCQACCGTSCHCCCPSLQDNVQSTRENQQQIMLLQHNRVPESNKHSGGIKSLKDEDVGRSRLYIVYFIAGLKVCGIINQAWA